MILLSVSSEKFPLPATALAFLIYVGMGAAVLWMNFNVIDLVCRAVFLIPLYRGVVAGFRLHQFRAQHTAA